MKIGFLSDRYLPQTDGVTYSVALFRTELERLGHEVYVVAPAPGLRYKETAERVIRIPAIKGLTGKYEYLFSLLFPPVAARQFDDIGWDIIHFHTPGQVGLLGAYYALRNHIPLVTTYHTDLFEAVKHYPSALPAILAHSLIIPWVTGAGLADFHVALYNMKPERSVDKWNQRIVEQAVTLVHNHCDLVIAPSPKMEQQLRDWHADSPLAVLPTGVDELPTTEAQIAAERALYKLGPDDEIILFVGRLSPEKNVELLIRAFALIALQRPQAKLMIVGDGPDRTRLMDQAAAAGLADRSIFTGRIERYHLGALYVLAKVFAFPSLADTQGLVLNEAALAGVTLVACDPLLGDILVNAQTGLLADPTAAGFAAKITWLLQHPHEAAAMGQAGRRVALRHSASAQAQKLVRLYQESKRAPRPRTYGPMTQRRDSAAGLNGIAACSGRQPVIRHVEEVGMNAQVAGVSRERLAESGRTTYRDLRLGILGLIVMLAASVIIEITQTSPTCVLPSISAYYYTPAQEIFVAALVAIGICMIAIEAPNEWENLLFNIAGMLAPVVAVVPVVDLGYCSSVTVKPQDAVPKIINNVWALSITGLVAVVTYLVVTTARSRPTDRANRRRIPRLRPPYLADFAAAAVILAGVIGWLQLDRTGFIDHAHNIAAITLFIAFFGATALNAWGFGDRYNSGHGGKRRYTNRYSVIAIMMLVTGLVLGLLTWVGHWYYGPLALEATLIALFAAFWLLQTIELWHAGLRPQPTPPKTVTTR